MAESSEATPRFDRAIVEGRARFEEMARGQIAAIEDGLLKMVVCSKTRKLLGIQIVGEGAAELVHIGQMAIIGEMTVDAFIDTIFNFPTLAEAYRVAALDVARQLPRPSVAPKQESAA